MKERVQVGRSQPEELTKVVAQARKSRLCAPAYATILRQIIFLSDAIASVRACAKDEIDPSACLALKELGIWCYLAFDEAGNEQFLFQAEKCFDAATRWSRSSCTCVNDHRSFACAFSSSTNKRHPSARFFSDSELNAYYALVLWAKIQWYGAPWGDQVRCAELLEQCVRGDSISLSGDMWFRLGVVYEKGIGRSPDARRAQHCFDRARECGLRIS